MSMPIAQDQAAEEEAVAEEPAAEVFLIRDFLLMYGEHSEVRRQVLEVMEQDAHGERIFQELWETSWAPGFQAYDDEGKAKQAPTLLHTIDCSLSGVAEKAARRRKAAKRREAKEAERRDADKDVEAERGESDEAAEAERGESDEAVEAERGESDETVEAERGESDEAERREGGEAEGGAAALEGGASPAPEGSAARKRKDAEGRPSKPAKAARPAAPPISECTQICYMGAADGQAVWQARVRGAAEAHRYTEAQVLGRCTHPDDRGKLLRPVPGTWITLEVRATRRTQGGSGAAATNAVFEYGDVLSDVPPTPPPVITPDGAQFEPHANALTPQLSCLPREEMLTDESACAIDAFNMGVGKRVLTRENVGVPEGAVMYMHEGGVDTRRPVCQPAIERAGYQLARVGGKKGKRRPPSFAMVLAQRRGVYLVEFYWRMQSDGAAREADWHVVAVNCDQRRVWCNAAGVLPFAMGKAKESAKTHADLLSHLHIVNVTRAWRILRK